MKKSLRKILPVLSVASLIMLAATPAYGMHIAEGVLPPTWSMGWAILYLPFLIAGILSIRKKCAGNSRIKMLLAMVGAFCFVLSALKLPSVTGSSSHPTGVGLGTVLFGPAAMAAIGFIVLLFQALLLAHGGITTIGANAFSMAVAGPFVGYGVYVLAKKCKAAPAVAVFLAAAIADLFTYIVTSFQLALAFNNVAVPFSQSLLKFMSVFAVTQIPLAIVEGILTALIYTAIRSLCQEELDLLQPNVSLR